MSVTNDELNRVVAGRTAAALFAATVAGRPDAAALRWREGDGFDAWTWAEYADRAARVAGTLASLGVGAGSRVVLMLRNRPEFHVADVAALLLRATPISIYNSSSPEQIAYLVRHSRATVAVVEAAFLDRFLAAGVHPDPVGHVIVVDDAERPGADGLRTWEEALEGEPVDLASAAAAVRPDDVATVIYTSGTTGPPKGVVIDHANVCWTIESLRRTLHEVEIEGSRLVSYLPMAHVAERMTSHYQAMALGYEVTTCPEPGQIGAYLSDVRPNIVFAVPRVWEKIHAGVHAVISGADDERRRDYLDALEVGALVAEIRARGDEPTGELADRYARVEAEILGPVRALLGLDQLVTAISGAAPITREVLGFFRGLGVPLSEIYGLSETSGPLTWEPFRVRVGTVGPAIPGLEVRLGEDGEVLCRGGNVFRGYLDDPDKTADALDADGWLHTGDIGVFDEAGYLRIVDRKKELIITAGGKNVSPANLEGALKALPLVGQACVVGDNRPFVAALLVLDPEVAPAWAKSHGIDDLSLPALAAHPDVLAEVQRGVDEVMRDFNQAERVKRFVLLGDEWLPDSEELTPTMKLKRRGVHQKYEKEIAGLYD